MSVDLTPDHLLADHFVPAQGRNVVYGYRNFWNLDGTQRSDAPDGIEKFIYRPAQIVRVWMLTGLKTCNLIVFLDGPNDANLEPLAGDNNLVVWKPSIPIGLYDEEGLVTSHNPHYLPRVPEATLLTV